MTQEQLETPVSTSLFWYRPASASVGADTGDSHWTLTMKTTTDCYHEPYSLEQEND